MSRARVWLRRLLSGGCRRPFDGASRQLVEELERRFGGLGLHSERAGDTGELLPRWASPMSRESGVGVTASRAWAGLRRGLAGQNLRTLSWWLCLLVLVAVATPVSAQGSGEGFFGSILSALRTATDEWAVFLLGSEGGSTGAALVIFGLCAVLQVIYFGYRVLFASLGGQSMGVGAVLARQLTILVFMWLALWFWARTSVWPVSVFYELGKEATGLERGLEPDVLAGAGIGMLQVFLSPKLLLFNNPLSPFAILYLLFAVLTVGAMVAIGVRALMLTVEGHVLVAVGCVPFAFSGFHFTAGLADNYIRYAARFGLEYMLLMFFVDMGGHLGATWMAELEAIPIFRQDQVFVVVIKMTVVAVAWALVTIRLPMKMAGEFIHLWTPKIAEGLR